MLQCLAYLRELNMASITVRLLCAMAFGGAVGIERGRKRRPAGFRTYMLVCLGAALTMLLSQYIVYMQTGPWAVQIHELGLKNDVSRFGAQVVNGIGFLGAGTILVTGHQEVKGLTTAAGLWASACAGLAIGAGFYEGTVMCFALVFICIHIFPVLVEHLLAHTRNMNIYVELESINNIGALTHLLHEQEIQIYDVEPDTGSAKSMRLPNATISLRLPKGMAHEIVVSGIAKLDCIVSVDEI